MLRNSFIHIPGIGKTTERSLWDRGLKNWDAAYNAARSGRLANRLAAILKDYIPESKEALSNRDIQFFYRLSRLGEAWRFYPELEGNCVFLDIETTGLSSFFDQITVVGLYDGNRYKAFVEGQDLESFIEELKKFSMVVTFNGALFDLRFIKAHFPDAPIPPVHIDLRFLTRRLGLTGGLKLVEDRLGISRPKDIRRLSGYDATVLWSRYRRGDTSALELLIKYNMQDVVSLKTILEIAYDKLKRRTALFHNSDHLRKLAIGLRTHLAHSAKTVSDSRNTQEKADIVSNLIRAASKNGRPPKIVGIDLTGSSRRASGWAFLSGEVTNTKLLKTDKQIVDETLLVKPDLVSIDSPLSLPAGYPRHPVIYRQCERALKRLGISVFWCLLPSMRKLTMRGIRLARKFRETGLHVIESYPGAAQDVLLIPRKKASTEELKWGLIRAGFKGNWVNENINHDELDAITSALVGLFFLADEYLALGNAKEDYLIIPRTRRLDEEKLGNLLDILAQLDLDWSACMTPSSDAKLLNTPPADLHP
jgi:uncharacterized protein YprB with RNaseH-like and TPR domain/predicted nuclease with RNAse H fold